MHDSLCRKDFIARGQVKGQLTLDSSRLQQVSDKGATMANKCGAIFLGCREALNKSRHTRRTSGWFCQPFLAARYVINSPAHAILVITMPTHFSACKIEKLGRTWVRG